MSSEWRVVLQRSRNATRARVNCIRCAGMRILLQRATHRIERSSLALRVEPLPCVTQRYCSLVTIISTLREREREIAMIHVVSMSINVSPCELQHITCRNCQRKLVRMNYTTTFKHYYQEVRDIKILIPQLTFIKLTYVKKEAKSTDLLHLNVACVNRIIQFRVRNSEKINISQVECAIRKWKERTALVLLKISNDRSYLTFYDERPRRI